MIFMLQKKHKKTHSDFEMSLLIFIVTIYRPDGAPLKLINSFL
jgi:predicted acetyltransferase